MLTKTWTKIVPSEYSTPAHPEQAKVTITAEIDPANPYLSITQETCYRHKNSLGQWGRWSSVRSCGQGYEVYAAYFPEVAPYFKWHLTDVKTGPRHYLDNALYWAGFGRYNGHQDRSGAPDPYAAFKSTIVFGAVDTDANVNPDDCHAPNGASQENVATWLGARFDFLMAAFDRDMLALFGPEYANPRVFTPEYISELTTPETT